MGSSEGVESRGGSVTAFRRMLRRTRERSSYVRHVGNLDWWNLDSNVKGREGGYSRQSNMCRRVNGQGDVGSAGKQRYPCLASSPSFAFIDVRCA